MAAPRFLCKTELAGLSRVAWAGRPVIAEHERLRAAIAERAPGAAGLLAEPVASATAISWYAEGNGEAEALTSLSPARRAEAERQLATTLAALQPLANDADLGPLVRRALVLPEADRIMVLDERPVLTGWGLAPPDKADSAAGLAEQLRAVLGRHVPAFSGIDSTFFAAPAATAAAPAAPAAPASPAAPAAPAGVAAPPAAAGPPRPPNTTLPPPPPPAAPSSGPGRSWWMLPAALGIAVVFLLLGFFLAWRIVEMQARQPLAADLLDEARVRAQVEMQRQTNEALQAEIERARQALAGNVCRPEGPLAPGLLPPSMTPVPPGALPPPAGGTAPPGQTPPAGTPDGQAQTPPGGTPGQPVQPGTVAPQPQPFRGSLAQLLDQAVVLILAFGEQGRGHGSGFFIAPDVVMTNAHVATHNARLFVLNRAFPQPLEAELVASSREAGAESGVDSPDFAVLRVRGAPAVQPLGLTTVAEKLQDVVAAGFPGQVVRMDANMETLLRDLTGTPPDLVLTTGVISAIQQTPTGLTVMPHTASISPGNSGGPLVDRCGRVVGVNTFGRRAEGFADRVNYAQKIDEALPFLQRAGITGITPLTGACEPQVPATALPAAPPGAPPPAPGATPPPGGSEPSPPTQTPSAPAAPAAPAAPR